MKIRYIVSVETDMKIKPPFARFEFKSTKNAFEFITDAMKTYPGYTYAIRKVEILQSKKSSILR